MKCGFIRSLPPGRTSKSHFDMQEFLRSFFLLNVQYLSNQVFAHDHAEITSILDHVEPGIAFVDNNKTDFHD